MGFLGFGRRVRPVPAAPPPAPLPAAPDPAPLPPAPPPTALLSGVPVGVPLRITDASDGPLVNRGYSYWSQVVIRQGIIWLFAHTAEGPLFFSVEGGQIRRHGRLVHHAGEGEGWSFTADGWIDLCDGPRLHRVDPFSGADIVVADISGAFPGCDLWQSHSAQDGRTHSATVRRVTESGAYPKLGTVVYRDGGLLRFEAPTLGELDESAISDNGRFLLIKEGPDDDNRIFNLDTGSERVIRKAEGALGHSDMGPDWAIGDDRTQGAATWINLATPDERRVLVRFPDWNLGHLCIRAGRCLLTHGELITLLDPVTGAVTVIAPHGMTGSGYDFQVFANMDPSGQVACYLSNAAGRLDAYVLVLG